MSLRVQRHPTWVRLTLDRPEARNALNNATIAELDAALRQSQADPQVRCIVIEGGGGQAFCAGIDLVERRGGDVRFSVRGQRPVPPPAVCRALLDEVGTALLAVRSSARVTLSAAGAGVAVSVVTDAVGEEVAAANRANAASGASDPPNAAFARSTDGEITTVTVTDEERTWVEARWTPSAGR